MVNRSKHMIIRLCNTENNDDQLITEDASVREYEKRQTFVIVYKRKTMQNIKHFIK